MPETDGLLKLGEYNKRVRQTFTVHEAPQDHNADQYFVLFGSSEGEDFRPENIRGIWGADTVATAIAHYRETGVLRIPKHYYQHPVRGIEYDYYQPAYCYFLGVEAVLGKKFRYEPVDELKEVTIDGL